MSPKKQGRKESRPQSPQAKALARRRSSRYAHIQKYGKFAKDGRKCRSCESKRWGRADCRYDGVGTACNLCVKDGQPCSFTGRKVGRQPVDRVEVVIEVAPVAARVEVVAPVEVVDGEGEGDGLPLQEDDIVLVPVSRVGRSEPRCLLISVGVMSQAVGHVDHVAVQEWVDNVDVAPLVDAVGGEAWAHQYYDPNAMQAGMMWYHPVDEVCRCCRGVEGRCRLFAEVDSLGRLQPVAEFPWLDNPIPIAQQVAVNHEVDVDVGFMPVEHVEEPVNVAAGLVAPTAEQIEEFWAWLTGEDVAEDEVVA